MNEPGDNEHIYALGGGEEEEESGCLGRGALPASLPGSLFGRFFFVVPLESRV